jgi:hypothetical protein
MLASILLFLWSELGKEFWKKINVTVFYQIMTLLFLSLFPLRLDKPALFLNPIQKLLFKLPYGLIHIGFRPPLEHRKHR